MQPGCSLGAAWVQLGRIIQMTGACSACATHCIPQTRRVTRQRRIFIHSYNEYALLDSLQVLPQGVAGQVQSNACSGRGMEAVGGSAATGVFEHAHGDRAVACMHRLWVLIMHMSSYRKCIIERTSTSKCLVQVSKRLQCLVTTKWRNKGTNRHAQQSVGWWRFLFVITRDKLPIIISMKHRPCYHDQASDVGAAARSAPT